MSVTEKSAAVPAGAAVPAWDGEPATAALINFVDNGGVSRVKCVPLSRLERACTRGVGMSVSLGAWTSGDVFDAVPGYPTAIGDMRLVGDLGAARHLPVPAGWLWVPADQRDQEGRPWPGCQRGFLRRMVERAAERGLSFVGAFELEWSVGVAGAERWTPGHCGPAYGAGVGSAVFDYLRRVSDELERTGVGVECVHPEYGIGQVELALPPVDPIAACDAFVFTRQLVRGLAPEFGFAPSFSPMATEGSGNGAHAHFSLWRDGRNLFAGGDGRAGLTAEGEAFVAGVLDHLPAMTAIGAPIPLSYLRLQPSSWSGAYACWGHENREAALRLEATVGPSAASSANVEWKAVDTAANPYLVYGAIIAAGLDGVERGLTLPEPVVDDPHALSDAQRAAAGAVRLPATLAAAVDLYAGDAVLREAMGDLLFDSVAITRRCEERATAGLDEAGLIDYYRELF